MHWWNLGTLHYQGALIILIYRVLGNIENLELNSQKHCSLVLFCYHANGDSRWRESIRSNHDFSSKVQDLSILDFSQFKVTEVEFVSFFFFFFFFC